LGSGHVFSYSGDELAFIYGAPPFLTIKTGCADSQGIYKRATTAIVSAIGDGHVAEW
jgi:hypothetical protein